MKRAEKEVVDLRAALESESKKCRILEGRLGKKDAKYADMAHQLALEKECSAKWYQALCVEQHACHGGNTRKGFLKSRESSFDHLITHFQRS